MTVLVAAIRPDDWNVPLLLHILGAMVLMGAVLTGGSAFALARGEAHLERLGYRALLVVALPAWILMRAAAEWIYAEEGWDDVPSEPDWLGIGFITADASGLLLLVALVTGGIGIRRLSGGGGAGLRRTAMVLSWVILVGLVVATWAMGAKPA